MTKQTCEKAGAHQLPEDEDSWGAERCDTLVAAGLDQCLPCQNRLIAELSATLTDDFGRLFTTWVISTINRHVTLGARLPDTALELFGPNGGPVSSPSRKALRRVKIPRVAGAPAAMTAFSLDAKGATTVLTAMKPDEREAVLNDVMDGIVASISLPQP
ncbi:hypothetical protein [Streptomyces sp. NPDC093589]|uniref:hypothetical protein n=1 Tax=Streptomyces sp. NPDC093589 TaxID=3366043 RepID=UPI00382078C4